MTPLSPRYAVVGGFYPSAPRGVIADVAAARALGSLAYPVCSALVLADGAVVTDVTDIPEDTVSAQLEHLSEARSPDGLSLGVLANHRTVAAVMRHAERWTGPVTLDIEVSGPSGETVLTQRGMTTLLDHLGVPDVVLASRTDAELAAGCEISSLDDAQVAAQRLGRRGARAVVIKCGVLPNRHFEADAPAGDNAFFADLYYDGTDFALYEAPAIGSSSAGATAAHSAAVMAGLMRGLALGEALQIAKQFSTDALRLSGDPSLGPAYLQAAARISLPDYQPSTSV